MMPTEKAEKKIKVFNDFLSILKKTRLFLSLRLKVLGFTIANIFNIYYFRKGLYIKILTTLLACSDQNIS